MSKHPADHYILFSITVALVMVMAIFFPNLPDLNMCTVVAMGMVYLSLGRADVRTYLQMSVRLTLIATVIATMAYPFVSAEAKNPVWLTPMVTAVGSALIIPTIMLLHRYSPHRE